MYTLRGKFKQYFLRVPIEGERDSRTANLKVTPERTLEIYIEDVRIVLSAHAAGAHYSTEPGSAWHVSASSCLPSCAA